MTHNRPPDAPEARTGVPCGHPERGDHMGPFTLNFEDVDRTMTAIVGGKGAGLGELSRIAEVRVPAGFCVTTDAFRLMLAGGVDLDAGRGRRRGPPGDRGGPDPRRGRRGDRRLARPRSARRRSCAVRSSATAEDLPTASFAGQQDSYLDVRGPAAILDPRAALLGLALHRAGRRLPPAQRLRRSCGGDGGGRAADGLPDRRRDPVHRRSTDGRSQGRLDRGRPRTR